MQRLPLPLLLVKTSSFFYLVFISESHLMGHINTNNILVCIVGYSVKVLLKSSFIYAGKMDQSWSRYHLPCPLGGLDMREVSMGLALLGGEDGIGARLGDVTLLAEAAPLRRLEHRLALLAGDDMLSS